MWGLSVLEIDKVYYEDCLDTIRRMKEEGVIPDLIVTDPPYEFESMTGRSVQVGRGVVNYGNITDIETNHFDFEAFIPSILDLQGSRVNAYFFTNKTLIPKYLSEAVKRNLSFDILAIRKLNPIPAKASSFLPELEYIIFLRSEGVFFNGTMKSGMYKKIFDKFIGEENTEHANQKPLQLIRNYIMISSREGDLVADFFMGSGTTAKASLMLGRHFIGSELNPRFIGVIERNIRDIQEQKCLLTMYIEENVEVSEPDIVIFQEILT